MTTFLPRVGRIVVTTFLPRAGRNVAAVLSSRTVAWSPTHTFALLAEAVRQFSIEMAAVLYNRRAIFPCWSFQLKMEEERR